MDTKTERKKEKRLPYNRINESGRVAEKSFEIFTLDEYKKKSADTNKQS